MIILDLLSDGVSLSLSPTKYLLRTSSVLSGDPVGNKFYSCVCVCVWKVVIRMLQKMKITGYERLIGWWSLYMGDQVQSFCVFDNVTLGSA